MTDTIDEVGPVDYIVVEFPGSKFNGEIAPTLIDLVDREIVRVLDLILIVKEADGSFDAIELSDLDESKAGDLRHLEAHVAELLSEEDVIALTAAIEPGSTAALLVYENRWAAPFAAAVRHSGGQLVANGRIPIEAIVAALEDDQEEGD